MATGKAKIFGSFVDGVREYFKVRPHDLLIIDVAAGEGWEKLCPFLEQPIPDANVTQVRWISVDDIVTVATLAGEELMRRYEGGRLVGSAGSSGNECKSGKELAYNKKDLANSVVQVV